MSICYGPGCTESASGSGALPSSLVGRDLSAGQIYGLGDALPNEQASRVMCQASAWKLCFRTG